MPLVFTTFLISSTLNLQAQDHPPEPMAEFASIESPCGSGDGGETVGVPPPVGLCLPINDYLWALLVSGVVVGSYGLRIVETKK